MSDGGHGQHTRTGHTRAGTEPPAATNTVPFVVTPLGGVEEVGRSCFHVQAADHDYLVDCGLKQSTPVSYPNFDELSPGQLDGAFVTHAHIDHIGGLPVAEAQGLFADDAQIWMTRPTDAVATVLLHDSLQIHKQHVAEDGLTQRYTEEDVQAVLNRVTGMSYERAETGPLTFEFGDAAHLLGSAWLALETAGRRVVFSGDLGGRSAHLDSITSPPEAEQLFLESTYGDTLQHPSFDGARSDLFDLVSDAHAAGIPVLIPTFGVGRAQEILQLFREREDQLGTALSETNTEPETPSIIYDGLITDSMPIYEVFCQDAYMGESILNYRINSGDTEPFTPDCASTPETMAERERVLDGESAPIIVAPSGMLTGGWSPYYLRDLARHYETARIVFIGYQAVNTPGRTLLEATDETASVTVRVLPAPDEYDHETDSFGFQEETVTIPTTWVRQIGGLSAHAAGNTLLEFARDVSPTTISLVHGDPDASRELAAHLTNNTDAEEVSVARMGESLPILSSAETPPEPVGDEEMSLTELRERQEALEAAVAELREAIDQRSAADSSSDESSSQSASTTKTD